MDGFREIEFDGFNKRVELSRELLGYFLVNPEDLVKLTLRNMDQANK